MFFYLIKQFSNKIDIKYNLIFGFFIYLTIINYYPNPYYSLFIPLDIFITYINYLENKNLKHRPVIIQEKKQVPIINNISINDVLEHTYKNIGL